MLDHGPVRIYLNFSTHLSTAVDYSGPLARSGHWSFVGDVTRRTYYSLWWLAKGGIHLPMQRNIESNGLPDQMYILRKLQIVKPLLKSDPTIPQDVRAKFDPHAPDATINNVPLGNPTQPAKELAPGIVFIPGDRNATLVQQDGDIVIVEAPIPSGHPAQIIAKAHRRFPGEPIKAVITTSDSWPHLAGIREHVAQGIPIHALDLNRPILERVIAMPYTSRPDTRQHTPRKREFHLVHDKAILGTGANRIKIYPIHGETSERQMMVYFPQHRLLYGNDTFSRCRTAHFFSRKRSLS